MSLSTTGASQAFAVGPSAQKDWFGIQRKAVGNGLVLFD